MPIANSTLKQSAKISIYALVILLAGAIIFYKARVFYLDSSYICFNILRYQQLTIQEHRWGSFITQMVPLIAYKLHFSMKVILIAYTISFNVFYLLVILLLVYRFRQYALAILMGLYYVLFFSDAYFWTNNEVFQGMAWMFLFLGTTIYLGYKKVKTFVIVIPFLALGTLAVFTHFLVIIPIVFLWIYLVMDKTNWPFSKKQTILFSVLLVAVIVTKFIFSYNQSYDGEKLHTATRFSLHDIIFFFATPVVRNFIMQCLINYWVAVLIFVAGIIHLFRNKQFKLAVFTLVAVLGYIEIMAITYGGMGDILLFHIESEWTGLSIIMACPFVFGLLPKLKWPTAAIALAIIFIVRFAYIGASATKFTGRERFMEEVLSKMKNRDITKLILINNDAIQNTFILTWAVPDESLLMSASAHDKPQRTFIIANDTAAARQMMTDNKHMLASFEIVNPASLNPALFYIDTTQPYRVMTYDELFGK